MAPQLGSRCPERCAARPRAAGVDEVVLTGYSKNPEHAVVLIATSTACAWHEQRLRTATWLEGRVSNPDDVVRRAVPAVPSAPSLRFHVVLFASTSVRSFLFASALVQRVSLCLTCEVCGALRRPVSAQSPLVGRR